MSADSVPMQGVIESDGAGAHCCLEELVFAYLALDVLEWRMGGWNLRSLLRYIASTDVVVRVWMIRRASLCSRGTEARLARRRTA